MTTSDQAQEAYTKAVEVFESYLPPEGIGTREVIVEMGLALPHPMGLRQALTAGKWIEDAQGSSIAIAVMFLLGFEWARQMSDMQLDLYRCDDREDMQP